MPSRVFVNQLQTSNTCSQGCLVHRPHYYARQMCFGSRDPTRILHRRRTPYRDQGIPKLHGAWYMVYD